MRLLSRLRRLGDGGGLWLGSCADDDLERHLLKGIVLKQSAKCRMKTEV